MTYTDKHIIETYSGLLKCLSSESKAELIENLTKSIQSERTDIEAVFYKSFGAFVSDKPAEEIVTEIKSARKFRNKEIEF